jgi:anti-anti-sigma factor
LTGDLDGSSYDHFQKEALQTIAAGARFLLLDFSQLHYISSAGLRSLYTLSRTLAAKGGAAGVSDMSAGAFKSPFLKLLNPSPNVHAALDVMGFNMSMEIYNDLNEALASF